MRFVNALILLPVLMVPVVAAAQSGPSVDQITKALSRPANGAPAAPQGSSALTVTADMLRGPTRGITLAPVPAGPATAIPVAATTRPAVKLPATTDTDMCATGSGACALVVQFESGSAVLNPVAEATLNKLGQALTDPSNTHFRFRIEGHTDTVGSEQFNQTLSDARARAVASYLEQHFAIEPARLQSIGLGKTQLLAAEPDQTPDERNRRVRVVNIGA